MGEVIRKSAAAEDILADCKTSLEKARAKGGATREHAEGLLVSPITIYDRIAANILDRAAAVRTLQANLDAANDHADAFMHEKSDQIWNATGRVRGDAAFDLLFPGGASYYTDGNVEEQPDRMDLLAELLESGIHPRLTAEQAHTMAASIRAEAATLRTHCDAIRRPRAQLQLYERVKTAVSRTAQTALSSLKRAYLSERLSEAEIHAIIPDRPRPHVEKTPTTPGTPAAPPVPPKV